MTILDIIGLKVVAIKGYPNSDKRVKTVEAEFILFDDGKTYIQFEEQDYYSYHDCSSNARHISIYSNDVESYNHKLNLPDATKCSFMW